MPADTGAEPTAVPPNRWWILVAVLYGLFAVNVTITILAVSIHQIAGEFDTTEPNPLTADLTTAIQTRAPYLAVIDANNTIVSVIRYESIVQAIESSPALLHLLRKDRP